MVAPWRQRQKRQSAPGSAAHINSLRRATGGEHIAPCPSKPAAMQRSTTRAPVPWTPLSSATSSLAPHVEQRSLSLESAYHMRGVGGAGLEPARLAPPDPKSGLSTNFNNRPLVAQSPAMRPATLPTVYHPLRARRYAPREPSARGQRSERDTQSALDGWARGAGRRDAAERYIFRMMASISLSVNACRVSVRMLPILPNVSN